MATITDLIQQIGDVNALGVANLTDKGVEVSADATTYEIMKGIADVSSGGSELDALETLIDESGVLDSTEGTATEKVEELIDKAESEKGWYIQSKIWTDEFRYLLRNSTNFKKLPKLQFDNATYITQFLYNSSVEEIDYYINSSKLVNCNLAFAKTTNLKHIVGIDISNATNGDGIFANSGIEEIDEPLNPINMASYAAMITFNGSNNLRKIRFTPESIKWSMRFSTAVLTPESIQSIIDGLATVETAQTLTLNSAITLTDEQKAIINAKGWTLAQ